jgi:hypothetical protein
VGSEAVVEAAALGRRAAEACDLAGRPIHAAHAADGEAARQRVEERTDRLAAAPAEALGEALGEAGCDRLERLLAGVDELILAGGGFPVPNPIGLVPAPAVAR